MDVAYGRERNDVLGKVKGLILDGVRSLGCRVITKPRFTFPWITDGKQVVEPLPV